ncbi:gerN [Symbiodinium natans]|uniref:GerN protein n=1 Tax=Symbiodinium natans TaxID=878477 RepID=A0A812I0Y3_9DINO|nr:gerN [Symbiodinium natans]
MGGASSFVALLAITGFLGASWTASKVSQAMGISDIVLVIATGVLLGPDVGGLISTEYSQCSHARHSKECELHDLSSLTNHLKAVQEKGICNPEDYEDPHHRRLAGGGSYHSYEECLEKSCHAEISHDCQLTPDVFTLIGHAGVALMIFESGMHFDFQKAKVVGLRACIVAVLGTCLPLVAGTLLTMAYGKPFFPHGVAVGTALAPTSVGIALRLLGEAGVLKENFGQAIITAAFVDDILSLILFNVLFSLGGEFDVVAVVVNPVVGVLLMIFATILALTFWPKFINGWLLPKVPVKEGAKVARTDEVLFFLMFALLIVYAVITHFLGTHLWGCFIAGMSFATLDPPHHAHHVWVRQTKRVTSWMIRIFFACTVAFSIPITQLLSVEALWKGSIMGVVACILTKVCCAPFMGDAKWVIGWAMVGRAEFAYLIAQMAAANNMLDEEMFSIVIWALLWATIFAPFVFRFVLNRYIKRNGLEDLPANKSFFQSGPPEKLCGPGHESKEATPEPLDLEISPQVTMEHQLEAGVDSLKPERPLADGLVHPSDTGLSDRQTSAGTAAFSDRRTSEGFSDGVASRTAL